MSGIVNPPSSAPNESKSARKKKAKAEAAAAAAAAAAPPSPIKDASSPVEGSVNGADVESEHPFIKELQKKLRNVNKKLNAMDKLNAVLKENPNVALDDLVAQKKINNDQKAQALKKPQLEADREQFEEQLAQYKKVNDDHQKMLKGQREQLEAAHAEKLKEVERTAQATAEAKAEEATKERLLIFSKFLRAAAARRQECDDDSELSRAFEGALLQVYGGNPEAVEAALKLIGGSTEPVLSTEGIALTITYAEVKESSIKDIEFADQKAWAEEVAQSEPVPPASNAAASAETGTDPTVAHAGLTEINDSVAATNGDSHDESPAPAATSVEDSSANAAGAEQWDSKVPVADDPLTESFEMVPRNPSETEAIHQPAPAASTQSWAEDTPALSAPETPTPVTNSTPAPNGEGFQEVAHTRGGRGRGGFQGERGRGGYRGRGQGRGRGGNFHRGDRGRNGFRGGRGRDQAQTSA
ncbi:hypothetical protein IWX90DRAFT_413806 [Phyllosticta citrichinensis]|uniref:YAG7-like dimerisation domain-containing protein n=1 Tax=Phyllosticta citrichinensis TaxID=1130410 RepID=A0ABR1XVN3_9PEZI